MKLYTGYGVSQYPVYHSIQIISFDFQFSFFKFLNETIIYWRQITYRTIKPGFMVIKSIYLSHGTTKS